MWAWYGSLLAALAVLYLVGSALVRNAPRSLQAMPEARTIRIHTDAGATRAQRLVVVACPLCEHRHALLIGPVRANPRARLAPCGRGFFDVTDPGELIDPDRRGR